LKQLALISLIFFCLCHHTSALNTSILFEIEPSQVGNLYYEVIKNDQRIEKDINYQLYFQDQQIQQTTKNGIIFISNLPFGSYKLMIENHIFPIEINSHYLKTQHLLKPLNISSKIYHQTSDHNTISLFIYSSIFSSFFLLIMYKKRGLHYG